MSSNFNNHNTRQGIIGSTCSGSICTAIICSNCISNSTNECMWRCSLRKSKATQSKLFIISVNFSTSIECYTMIIFSAGLRSTHLTQIDNLSCLIITNDFCFRSSASNRLSRREESRSNCCSMSQFSNGSSFIIKEFTNSITNIKSLISNVLTLLQRAVSINNINYNVIDKFIGWEV